MDYNGEVNMPIGTRLSGMASTGNYIEFMVVNEFEECTEEVKYSGISGAGIPLKHSGDGFCLILPGCNCES